MGRKKKILTPPVPGATTAGKKLQVPPASKERADEKPLIQSDGLKEQLTAERANLKSDYQQVKGAEEIKERGKYVKKAEREAQAEAAAKLQKETSAMAGLATAVVNMVCERLPNPKPLSDFESNALESSTQKVLEKYWERVGQWSPEFSLAIVAGVIFVPRMQKPKEVEI